MTGFILSCAWGFVIGFSIAVVRENKRKPLSLGLFYYLAVAMITAAGATLITLSLTL